MAGDLDAAGTRHRLWMEGDDWKALTFDELADQVEDGVDAGGVDFQRSFGGARGRGGGGGGGPA